MSTRLRLLNVMTVLVMLLTAFYGPNVQPAQAASPDLFFSEYVEGTSNNKALEIYNGTGAPVDLAAGGYQIQYYFNGSAASGLSITLTGTIADGDVFVIVNSLASAPLLALADLVSVGSWYNGDDAITLLKGAAVIDTIGQIGFDPGSEWGTGLTSMADNTIRRKGSVTAGDPDGSNVFDPAVEWDGFATDTFDGLGTHTISTVDAAPAVTSTTPVDNAIGVVANANLTVTFTEPVNVTTDWFTLSCGTSGAHTAAVTGGPTTFSLDPAVDFVVGETCTLTVLANQVSDQDANDPPDNLVADFTISFSTADVCTLPTTAIPAIQGSGPNAAITGPVYARGIVIGDYEGAAPTLRGFYMQDPIGDGDPATSDGVFVYNASNDNVSLNDDVFVSGTVEEFQGQTQISSVAVLSKCGTGSVTPVDVTLPFAAAAFPERYEGMLVRMPQTLYVTEHFQLGRFGQVVMSPDARLKQPTNVVLPGAPAIALQAANNLNRIIVDDALNNQNPDPVLFGRGGNPLSAANTLRGGDTATGIVGVMTYTWSGNSASGNAYRVRPLNALGGSLPNFQPANPRPAAAPEVGGTLRVTGMNLLNFFNTFDGLPDTVDNCTNGVGGTAADCRGADTQAEFDRQWPKTVSAIVGSGADVIGINEIENDGYGPLSAIQFLVDQLNLATIPGTYAFIDVDTASDQTNAMGTDAIKVGMLYKPAVVTPVGHTAPLNSVEFVNGGDGAPRSRPSLAQAFEQISTGERFIVDVNHLKSKGSACDVPDAGDGQGNCNVVRTNAANVLTAWLAGDPTGTGDPDIILVGDYNSYAMEDPITVIKNAGYTNLIDKLLGADAYSYVFDGQWGYLDHALGSPSMVLQVNSVGEWHINSDEPSVLDYNTDFKSAGQIISFYNPDQFRISDHDPVIVGLSLFPNQAPQVDQAIPDQDVYASRPWSFTFAANTFSDPDAKDGDTLNYTATLADGSPLPAWLTFTGSTRTFSGTPPYANLGTLSLKVTATDLSGASVSTTFTVNILNNAPTVANPIPAQQITLNSPYNFTFAADTFADFDLGFGDELTYTASLADGSALPAWLHFDAVTRTFSGTPANRADVGVLTVRVTATDESDANVSTTFTLTVNEMIFFPLIQI